MRRDIKEILEDTPQRRKLLDGAGNFIKAVGCDDALLVYSGKEARKQLTRLWGVPNSCPRLGESYFGRSRVVFVDDDNDGKPMAYWVPDKEVRRGRK
ncbi:MAG: hypothetical protein DRJ03_02005 [Chloroflexi bacterium]|nr:MAG: hypothetical protein DRJ03_02005 [Chloroflexota bacterium]